MVKKQLLIGLIALSTTLLNAQEIQLTATLSDTEIQMGSTTVLTIQTQFSGSTQVPDPEIPDISTDFTLIANSFNTTYQIRNNRSSTQKIQKLTLAPKRIGTLKIPKIVLNTPEKRLETKILNLIVGEAPEKSKTELPNKKQEKNTPTLSLKASTQKTTLYEGEPTIYSLKLYRSVNLWSPPITETPKFENYWKEDLDLEEEHFETIDGEKLALMELAKTLIIPLTSTSNIISPARAMLRAPGLGGNGRALLTSNPIPITLIPLPEPKPENFKGTVGEFKLTHTLNAQTITQNTALSIEITLQGNGNIKSITELIPPETSDFKIYKSKITDDLKSPINGSRTFEYTLIAQTPGKLTLPPFKLHYFSPRTHSYHTVTTPPTAIFSVIEDSETPDIKYQDTALRGTKPIQKETRAITTITLLSLILLNIGLLLTHLIKLIKAKTKTQRPAATAHKTAHSKIKKLKKQDKSPKQTAATLLIILENFLASSQDPELISRSHTEQLQALKTKLNEIAYAPAPKEAKLSELITITQKLITRIERSKSK